MLLLTLIAIVALIIIMCWAEYRINNLLQGYGELATKVAELTIEQRFTENRLRALIADLDKHSTK